MSEQKNAQQNNQPNGKDAEKLKAAQEKAEKELHEKAEKANGKKRKIVSVCSDGAFMYALCDNGDLFNYNRHNSQWTKMKPIPDDVPAKVKN